MNTANIERYLNSFGKYIVKQARTNLTKGKKNFTFPIKLTHIELIRLI